MSEKSNLGLGVMLSFLSGDDARKTAEAIEFATGKRIERVACEDNRLRIWFEGGGMIVLWDGGQSCCERRYMVCDDDLKAFAGDTFLTAEIREASAGTTHYVGGAHEIQFLAVKTDRGEIVVASHNEHNGYYGGFAIRALHQRAA